MNRRIRPILKLLRHPRIRRLTQDLFRLRNRPLHPLRPRRQNQIRAQQGQQRPALNTHRLRHRQNQLVTLRCANKRQRNPRVPTRRFHDHRVLRDQSPRLAIFNHRHPDPILHTSQRIEELTLQRNRRLHTSSYPIEFDQWRIANRFDDVVKDAAHGVKDRRLKWAPFDPLGKPKGRQGRSL